MLEVSRDVILISNAEPDDNCFDLPLIEAVSQATEAEPIVIPYREAPAKAHLFNSATAMVMGGTPEHYEAETAERRQEYMKWVPDLRRPGTFICLGHQALGVQAGSEVLRRKEIEGGPRTVIIKPAFRSDPIFRYMSMDFVIDTMHWASIPEPEGYEIMASSYTEVDGSLEVSCQNQIMRHRDFGRHPHYGIQGHPENNDHGRQLLKNFFDMAVDFEPLADEATIMEPEQIEVDAKLNHFVVHQNGALAV